VTIVNTAARALSRHTRYLDDEFHTLGGLVRRGDVCLDAGAAAGLYSQALSRLVGPEGVVHSVEPLTFSHPFWSRVLGARRRGNVHHHAVALGAEPGRAAMRVPYGPKGPATSPSSTGRAAGSARTPSTPGTRTSSSTSRRSTAWCPRPA
jgi:FkbM family methyltransferase